MLHKERVVCIQRRIDGGEEGILVDLVDGHDRDKVLILDVDARRGERFEKQRDKVFFVPLLSCQHGRSRYLAGTYGKGRRIDLGDIEHKVQANLQSTPIIGQAGPRHLAEGPDKGRPVLFTALGSQRLKNEKGSPGADDQ